MCDSRIDWRPETVCPDAPAVIVIGCGDLCGGDLGIGLYAMDLLARVHFGPQAGRDAGFACLVGDYRNLPAVLCQTDLGVIVTGVRLGKPLGTIRVWDMDRLRTFLRGIPEEPCALRSLMDSLERLELGGSLPETLLLVLVEVEATQGVGLSPLARKALRSVVETVLDRLADRGAATKRPATVSMLYALPDLNILV